MKTEFHDYCMELFEGNSVYNMLDYAIDLKKKALAIYE